VSSNLSRLIKKEKIDSLPIVTPTLYQVTLISRTLTKDRTSMRLVQSSSIAFLALPRLQQRITKIYGLNALPSSLSLVEPIDPISRLIAQHPAISALSIDLRPRSRLKPRHKYLFDTKHDKSSSTTIDLGDCNHFELFDELAIACCNTGVVCRKELFETYAAACHIHAKFPHMKRIADLAAGHGLLSWFLLALDHFDNTEYLSQSRSSSPDPRPRTVICVDRRMPPSADAIAAAMIERFPEFEGRWSYVQSDLSAIEPHPSCLLTSVHACGTLTDFLIEIAIGSKEASDEDSDRNEGKVVGMSSPLAIVPCCHTVKVRKGYRPHYLSGMDAGAVVELVEERKKQQLEIDRKHEAVADVVDEVRCRTLRNAGYDIEEIMLPKSFTGRNRLLVGEPRDDAAEQVVVSVSESTCSANQLNIFEWQTPKDQRRNQEPSIRIPLADDEESIRQCHAISGRDRATKRFIEQIPNHFSPSLVMSIWLNTNDTDSTQGIRGASSSQNCPVLTLESLKNLANQCCREMDFNDKRYHAIGCEVLQFGDVNVQSKSGRRSQRYKFTYSMPKDTDISIAIVSRDTAKRIDGKIRERIKEKWGDILR